MLCGKYKEVKKVLLTSPVTTTSERFKARGLESFTGDLFIKIPEFDIVSKEEGFSFFEIAKKTSKKDLEIVKNCDHDWKNCFEKFLKLGEGL